MKSIDICIGNRYTLYIVRRYNVKLTKGVDILATTASALTEAVYYILLSLMQPLHGYGIMQNVENLSSGRVKLAAGTLYGAINTMLEKHWISALPEEKDSRKKEYIITSEGKEVLKSEMVRLNELLTNGKQIMGGLENEKDN